MPYLKGKGIRDFVLSCTEIEVVNKDLRPSICQKVEAFYFFVILYKIGGMIPITGDRL